MFKELGCDHGTDGVSAGAIRCHMTRAVPEPSGERVDTARFQITAEDVSPSH